MPKPRVIVADDHRLFVAGLERLLAAECEIVSTVFDSCTLLDDVRRLHPDVVVQDLSIPPLNGMDVIRRIREIDEHVKVVIVTMCEDPDLAAEAFRRGASAYILKNSGVAELLDGVRCAVQHRSYVTPLIAAGTIESLAKARDGHHDTELTMRQREVLRLLAEGKSMKQVAAQLNLTARTIAFHKYRMMQMLNIKSSAELVRFAVARQII